MFLRKNALPKKYLEKTECPHVKESNYIPMFSLIDFNLFKWIKYLRHWNMKL